MVAQNYLQCLYEQREEDVEQLQDAQVVWVEAEQLAEDRPPRQWKLQGGARVLPGVEEGERVQLEGQQPSEPKQRISLQNSE